MPIDNPPILWYSTHMTKDTTTKSALKLIIKYNKSICKNEKALFGAIDIINDYLYSNEAQEYIALHGSYGFKTAEEEQECELKRLSYLDCN